MGPICGSTTPVELLWWCPPLFITPEDLLYRWMWLSALVWHLHSYHTQSHVWQCLINDGLGRLYILTIRTFLVPVGPYIISGASLSRQVMTLLLKAPSSPCHLQPLSSLQQNTHSDFTWRCNSLFNTALHSEALHREHGFSSLSILVASCMLPVRYFYRNMRWGGAGAVMRMSLDRSGLQTVLQRMDNLLLAMIYLDWWNTWNIEHVNWACS